MHATANWLLVGLLVAAGSGCTTSRWNMAKSDPPKSSATDDEVRVKYGFPWGNGSKKATAKNEALAADLQAKLAEARTRPASNTTPANASPPGASVPDMLRQAALAEGSRDLAAAKQLYLKVLDSDPRNAEAHHRLGVIADQQQDTRAADQHYAKALSNNRKDSDLLHDVGYSHLLRGNLEESERYLKEALEVNSFNQRASEHLGQVYARQGKYDAALAMFRQCSTEREAQQMIAQAFPHGRPAGGNSQVMPVAAEQRTASAQPDFSQGGQTLDQIQQLMAQERSAAQRAREQRMATEMRPSWETDSPPRSPGAAPQSAAMPGRATLPQIADTLLPSVTPGPASVPLPQAAVGTATTASPAAPNWATGASVPPNTLISGQARVIRNADSQSNAPLAANANAAGQAAPSEQNAPTFWQGALANMPPQNPAQGSMGAANPYDMARVPAEAMSTGFGRPIPSGLPGSATAQADAARWAAQMAMGAGPGAMFPTVTQLSHTGGPADVRYAYGEAPTGAPINQVNSAVWSSDRPASTNTVPPTNGNGGIAPSSPWNNWQSPAPPSTNWMTPTDSAPAQPAPHYPAGSAEMNHRGSFDSAPPQWPAAPVTARPAQTADALGAFEAELRNAAGAAPATNTTFGAPTTIQNWPYQPAR
jgi:tetratricopeptide (TPR) repeat protein